MFCFFAIVSGYSIRFYDKIKKTINLKKIAIIFWKRCNIVKVMNQ